MPIMDGYEATTLIRNEYDNLNLDQPYIVACTGHTEDAFILKAWSNCIDEIVPKPARVDVVIKILQELLVMPV